MCGGRVWESAPLLFGVRGPLMVRAQPANMAENVAIGIRWTIPQRRWSGRIICEPKFLRLVCQLNWIYKMGHVWCVHHVLNTRCIFLKCYVASINMPLYLSHELSAPCPCPCLCMRACVFASLQMNNKYESHMRVCSAVNKRLNTTLIFAIDSTKFDKNILRLIFM